MTSGYFISTSDFHSLSPEVRSGIIELINKLPATIAMAPPAADIEATPDKGTSEVDENFMELSLSQAREFLGPVHAKTRTAIEVMVSGPTPKFRIKDIVKALSLESAGALRGVWAGITRRTRSLHGEDAYLLDWTKSDAVYDEAGAYIDQGGEMTEMTYRSFRRALGIDKD